MCKRILVALSLSVGLSLGLLLLLASPSIVALADGAILYVAPGADCGAATPCYGSVQAAVDGASNGDAIKIAGGTYSGVHNVPTLTTDVFTATQVVVVTKSVTIQGGYALADWTTSDPEAHPTILDARGQGRVLCIIGECSPTIEGLRISGGDASGLGGISWGDVGGGVYINGAAGLISDTRIYSNTAEGGGGLFLLNSSTEIQGGYVNGNSALGNVGGGLCIQYSSAILEHSTITNNTSDVWGGGIYVGGSAPRLTGNVIRNNSVTGYGFGGGVALSGTAAVLQSNLIADNTASASGGGLYLWDSDATLDGDIVRHNHAGSFGGGVYIHGKAPRVVNGVVMSNSVSSTSGFGAGIYAEYAAPRLTHLTIAGNSGGHGSAIHVTVPGSGDLGTILVTNTIVADHEVGISVMEGCTATLRGTLWHDNSAKWSGEGTIDHTFDRQGDPAFDADGYHLTSLSLAIDRGVGPGTMPDLDGDARPIGPGVDIGADEFSGTPIAWQQLHLPLIMFTR